MDTDTIKDDVCRFDDALFGETFDIIDDNFEFMDNLAFYESKRNHFLAFKFLNSMMQNFTNIDNKFSSETLRKLHRDINNLHKLYKYYKDSLKNVDEMFEKKFLPNIEVFKEIKEEMQYLKDKNHMDADDRDYMRILKRHEKELKKIYFSYFEDDYKEQLKDITGSLQNILNTKIYYFDSMLWSDAMKSDIIWRSMKRLKLDKSINSQKYIEYKIGVVLPYTDDYEYLQRCLRIYR